MTAWYFSYGADRIGPLEDAQAIAQAQQNPNGHCWRQGFTDWLPISQVSELSSGVPAVSVVPPPPIPGTDHEIDYKLYGEDMQFVEIELDPGESAIAEAGAMMYKDASIQLETVFGDGSAKSAGGGFMDKLVGAGKRLITGESLFTTVFTHTGQGKAHVAFAAPFPGTIVPAKLSDYGGRLICQKDSFLCAAKGVQIGIHFQKKILTGLFGGEGFIMQKLEGNGMAFLHAGGTIIERELKAGETLHVDTGCLVALMDSVHYDIQQVGSIKSALFGGEGLFLVHLTGPGKVWLQSLPFSRMAGRMLAAAPQRGGSRGEGSELNAIGALGALGNFLDGD
jgi:uncharacterized protein (TIGR00266 family)